MHYEWILIEIVVFERGVTLGANFRGLGKKRMVDFILVLIKLFFSSSGG